jgi:ketosteroid isomerase-like protein
MRSNRRVLLFAAGVSSLASVAPTAASDDPTAAINKELATKFVETVLRPNDPDGVDRLISSDVIGPYRDDAPGVDSYKARLKRWLQTANATNTDIAYSVDTLMADSERAVIRGYMSGTSKSGKSIQATYFVELSITDGKITGTWLAADSFALNGF